MKEHLTGVQHGLRGSKSLLMENVDRENREGLGVMFRIMMGEISHTYKTKTSIKGSPSSLERLAW